MRILMLMLSFVLLCPIPAFAPLISTVSSTTSALSSYVDYDGRTSVACGTEVIDAASTCLLRSEDLVMPSGNQEIRGPPTHRGFGGRLHSDQDRSRSVIEDGQNGVSDPADFHALIGTTQAIHPVTSVDNMKGEDGSSGRPHRAYAVVEKQCCTAYQDSLCRGNIPCSHTVVENTPSGAPMNVAAEEYCGSYEPAVDDSGYRKAPITGDRSPGRGNYRENRLMVEETKVYMSQPPPIFLRNGTLRLNGSSLFSGPGMYILQFGAPVQREWLDVLEKQGAEFYDYLPDYAFLTYLPSPPISAHIYGIIPFDWRFKIASIRSGTYRIHTIRDNDRKTVLLQSEETYVLPTHVESGQTTERRSQVGDEFTTHPSIADSGDMGAHPESAHYDDTDGALLQTLRKLGITAETRGSYVVADLNESQIIQIARLEEVKFLEPIMPNRPMNDVAQAIVGAPVLFQGLPVNGTGQIIGVADSGLDGGVINATLHPDLRGKVEVIVDMVGDGPEDLSGHGTHVVGTLVGTGAASDGTFAGIAPGATVYFQAVANKTGAFLIDDFYALLSDAYWYGARIHSDSWGSDAFGNYTGDAMDLDAFVRDHPDMLVVVAAGNSGVDGDGDGFVDLQSITSPGTAKNAITVGASESCRTSGGYANYTYGSLWPDSFPADPIASDLVSDQIEGVAAFSSRGPCTDGRLKPDLVAPGTDIISLRSSAANMTLWGIYNDMYLYSGGTSMATPLVAGAAALIREFDQAYGGVVRPAAFIKALLIATADDLMGQYPSDGASDPTPNYHEGWGRINLTRAMEPTIWISAKNLTTGDEVYHNITVAGGTSVRISMVWTDVEASLLTSVALVNDLDLSVISPNGTIYKGNVFKSGYSSDDDSDANADWDVNGDGYDERNNVECVFIKRPEPGTYTIRIYAKNCPYLQDVVVAVYGEISPDLAIVSVDLGTPRHEVSKDVNISISVENLGSTSPVVWRFGRLDEATDLQFNVSAVAYSYPYNHVMAVGEGGRVIAYDATTGTIHSAYADGSLYDAAFNPDGTYALIAGEKGLYRWTPYSGLQKVAGGSFTSVAFSPNGYALAVGAHTAVRYPSSRPVVLFSDDMSTDGTWRHGGTEDRWERGIPTADQARPGNHSADEVWGTDLDKNYPNGANMYLWTQIDLEDADNPVLTFWHYRDMEGSRTNYDGGVVEVFKDNEWIPLIPEGGYDADVGVLDGPGFCFDLQGWRKESFFLDEYVGTVFTFRFRFASDSSVTAAGWFIDDVAITDWGHDEYSVNGDLRKVAFNETSALIVGRNGTIYMFDGTMHNWSDPDAGNFSAVAWADAWYLFTEDGEIYRLELTGRRSATLASSIDITDLGGVGLPVLDADGQDDKVYFVTENGLWRYGVGLKKEISAENVTSLDIQHYCLLSLGTRIGLASPVFTPVEVRLVHQGEVLISKSASTSPTSLNLTLTWKPDSLGIYNLTVVVNPRDNRSVYESDYGNNIWNLSIVVSPPDLFVLVVDDDGGDDCEDACVDALGNISHVIWSTDEGTPSSEVMLGFDLVVWLVGDEFDETLNNTERAVIGAYLDAGGRLFIYGQDIGYAAYVEDWGSWYQTYLHARLVRHDEPATELTGTDLYSGRSLRIHASRPSAISPYNSRAVMYYPDGNASAVLYTGDHRIVYWAFGLHHISSRSDRVWAMNRTIGFLTDLSPPLLRGDLSQSDGTTGDLFEFMVRASDDTGVYSVRAACDFLSTLSDLSGGPRETSDSVGGEESGRSPPPQNDDGNYGAYVGNTSSFDPVQFIDLSYRDGLWVGNITVPPSARRMNYMLILTDFSGNSYQTAWREVNVTDNDPPLLRDISVGIPRTGGYYALRLFAQDNWALNESWAIYWFPGYNDTTINITVLPFITHYIAIPENATDLAYVFTASDLSRNINATEIIHVNISDTLPPASAKDLTEPKIRTGKTFRFSARFFDNIRVTNASVIYSFNGAPVINTTMTALQDRFVLDVQTSEDVQKVNYTFWSADASGNYALFGPYSRDALDVIPPSLFNDSSDRLAMTGEDMHFRINCTDNDALSLVWLSYSLVHYGSASGLWTNVSLTGNISYSTTLNIPAGAIVLRYRFFAVDVTGNMNATPTRTVQVSDVIPPEANLTLGAAVTGEPLTIWYNSSDNWNISFIVLNYTYGDENWTLRDLIAPEGSVQSLQIDVPLNAPSITYRLEVHDVSGHVTILSGVVDVQDDVKPEIEFAGRTWYKRATTYTVTVRASDNVGISEVKLLYWTDGDMKVNVTMSPWNGQYRWDIFPEDGPLHLIITAYDDDGNWARLEMTVREKSEEKGWSTEMILLAVAVILGAINAIALFIRVRRRHPPSFECPLCATRLAADATQCPGCGSQVDWSNVHREYDSDHRQDTTRGTRRH